MNLRRRADYRRSIKIDVPLEPVTVFLLRYFDLEQNTLLFEILDRRHLFVQSGERKLNVATASTSPSQRRPNEPIQWQERRRWWR